MTERKQECWMWWDAQEGSFWEDKYPSQQACENDRRNYPGTYEKRLVSVKVEIREIPEKQEDPRRWQIAAMVLSKIAKARILTKEDFACEAVEYADALIAELEK